MRRENGFLARARVHVCRDGVSQKRHRQLMRIAIVNPTRDRVGGIETYLEMLIPELTENGGDAVFLSETGARSEATPIALADDVAAWSVQDLGTEGALERLRRWSPNIIYAHGQIGLELMRGLLQVAPVVFYAHGYYGTCITGAKSFKFPVVRPCERHFGPGCFVHYYAHRCGGLNPLTMWREYYAQSERAEILRRYSAVLAPSEYIRVEYLRHGFNPETVYVVPYFFEERQSLSAVSNGQLGNQRPHRLLFVGRMTKLKGGMLLLEAMPHVARKLGRTLRLAFAGDGPERLVWQHRAESIRTANPNVIIEFAGWLGREDVESLYDASDLLVMPSLWPEPSALVGREAGLRGLPQAAFDVGGNSEWLIEGVNGHLAAGDPPTAVGFADAIVSCLTDPAHYAHLREGALKIGRQFSMDRHLRQLLPILEGAMVTRTLY